MIKKKKVTNRGQGFGVTVKVKIKKLIIKIIIKKHKKLVNKNKLIKKNKKNLPTEGKG